MLPVLERTVSMRRFFSAPKSYVQTDGLENISNFTLKNFVYLNLCVSIKNFSVVMVMKFYVIFLQTPAPQKQLDFSLLIHSIIIHLSA